MPPTEGSMRERIRQVSLELFTERGYDGTSLREIAEHRPATLSALGEIPGIGRAKLDAYGRAVLEGMAQR